MRPLIHAGDTISRSLPQYLPHSAEHLLIIPTADDTTRRPIAVCFVLSFYTNQTQPWRHTCAEVRGFQPAPFQWQCTPQLFREYQAGWRFAYRRVYRRLRRRWRGKSGPPSWKAGDTHQLPSSRREPVMNFTPGQTAQP